MTSEPVSRPMVRDGKNAFDSSIPENYSFFEIYLAYVLEKNGAAREIVLSTSPLPTNRIND